MLTDKGFQRPTFDELLAGRIDRAKQLFGDDVDTTERSALGKFIRLGVYDLAQAYETLEATYYARFPNSASGQSLDRLMPFAGTRRDPAVAAVHRVELAGTAGYAVPVGFLVASAGGQTFHTMAEAALGADGTAQVLVECDRAGTAGNVADIGQIVNPDADVSAVRYVGLETPGEEVQSDYDARVKFRQTVAGAGSATADAITAAVLRVQGVEGCLLVENDTEAVDADGRPPHSFECYVLAPEGADYEVAAAIFGKKPVGIKCVGETVERVPDAGGTPHEVRFTHTREVAVHIRVRVKAGTQFEADGAAQIAARLVEHIAGLKNGEDVILSTLYGDVHAVTGVLETTALELSRDGSAWAAGNITVGPRQVARSRTEWVQIEVIEYARQ